MFEELIKKYNLSANGYSELLVLTSEEYAEWITYLFGKWESRIAEYFYGFDLACLPEVWFKTIDEALDLIAEDSPDFKICQIKIKFGGIRLYLINVSDKVFDGIEELENALYDDSFVY